MAQLKDTLIQGSARVTDTLYANEINLGNVSASLPLFTDANKNFITKSAADTRTAIGVGASGTHADSYFVKAITSTDNNIPRFNSTTGQLQGSRMSINDNGLISLSYDGQYPGDIQYSNAAGLVGESWLDTGHATNVTSPRFYWLVRRPKSTAATTTETVYEQFRLPAATAGTAANATYEIITTKNLSNITSVGTITSGTWQGTAIAAAYIGNHSTDKLTSGTLGVARGGTGAGTFTDECIIVGNGTNALESRGLKVEGAVGANITLSTNTAEKTMTISSGSTIYIDSAANTSHIFRKGTTECARINKYGKLQTGAEANQQKYQFLVDGDSGFTGKVAFSNATATPTEYAYIQYDSTLHTLNFSVT